jgi:hypothetical protein
MKKLLTAFLLFTCINVMGQSQWVITKELWHKGQTVFVEAKQASTDSIGYFPIHFQGMGKRRNLEGLKATFHPYGIVLRRKKIYFTINQL